MAFLHQVSRRGAGMSAGSDLVCTQHVPSSWKWDYAAPQPRQSRCSGPLGC